MVKGLLAEGRVRQVAEIKGAAGGPPYGRTLTFVASWTRGSARLAQSWLVLEEWKSEDHEDTFITLPHGMYVLAVQVLSGP